MSERTPDVVHDVPSRELRTDEPSVLTRPEDPDASAYGFLDEIPRPARYGVPSDDPAESNGIVLRLIPPAARVLDVGCGMGFTAQWIRDRLHAEVVGLEPNAQRAAAARSLGLPVHSECLTEELVGRLGQFDVVLFMDVLEHVPDPLALLRTAAKALKPGGCVIASIPNVAHWTVRAKLLLGRFDYQAQGIMDATHLRWFTASTIRRLFDKAGLRVDFRAASAGTYLAVYSRPPLRWLGRGPIRFLARRWPTMFGCQYVVRGVVVSAAPSAAGDLE